ncbi:metallophosphoesterase family protein [Treponema socranskii]|uniref:metallophosphoesterase family protein n=1 Tax=Treponema socranskii TaxID=53419 RepID=UPI003D6F3585
MRVLLMSDIHSNFEAFSAVLSEEKGFDCLWCAGDLVDYGISPKPIIEWFCNHTAESRLVKGNHDEHLVNVWRTGEFENISSTQFKWVHQNCLQLNEYHVSFLDSLPDSMAFEADGKYYLMTHRFDKTVPYRDINSVEEFDIFWNAHTPTSYHTASERRIIVGHTHRQCAHCLYGNRIWINPGSISYRRPDENDKSAQYAVIENGALVFKRIPYDRSVQFTAAKRYKENKAMMETELQDFYFFFGNAKTTRDPLPEGDT